MTDQALGPKAKGAGQGGLCGTNTQISEVQALTQVWRWFTQTLLPCSLCVPTQQLRKTQLARDEIMAVWGCASDTSEAVPSACSNPNVGPHPQVSNPGGVG